LKDFSKNNKNTQKIKEKHQLKKVFTPFFLKQYSTSFQKLRLNIIFIIIIFEEYTQKITYKNS
jgi:hypothetical protein